MESIKHDIKHSHQHDEMSCGAATTSMLLSFFNDNISSQEIAKEVPNLLDDKGKNWGGNAVDQMRWCMRRGYKARGFVFDAQIMNQNWACKDQETIIEGLKSLKGKVKHPVLGKRVTDSFIASYIDYLNLGGELTIMPSPTRYVLHELLRKGPYVATVSYNTLYATDTGFMETHSAVVRGKDEDGNLLLADPFKEEWEQKVSPDHFIGAIMAAQMSCENAVYQIFK